MPTKASRASLRAVLAVMINPVYSTMNANGRRKKATTTAGGSQPAAPVFIDLFAGCGGLSLGLLNSGWTGLFAIEQSCDAFKALRHNLVDEGNHNKGRPRFRWPEWLNIEAHEIRKFIRTHHVRIRRLRGSVHLVAGGPPCQGFSFAGRRSGRDPRNELFKFHLEIVDLVRPEMVLLENVRGFDVAFGTKEASKKRQRGRPRKSYATRIRDALRDHGYHVQQELVRAVDFGVPQTRSRYFTVGIRRDLFAEDAVPDFFDTLRKTRKDFLRSRKLPIRRPITVSEAISDLEKAGKEIVACSDPESPRGFNEISYTRPVSVYQKLMHNGMNGRAPNSLRLVNHRKETIHRFEEILRTCRKGVQLGDQDRQRLDIKKNAITPLSPSLPSHTVTTLPDDLLHYSEPRIHTVREHARLQSFPDWFAFLGKYTTGADLRARECPRYTQVGNAVPPLLAEAMGQALADVLRKASSSPAKTGQVKTG